MQNIAGNLQGRRFKLITNIKYHNGQFKYFEFLQSLKSSVFLLSNDPLHSTPSSGSASSLKIWVINFVFIGDPKQG